jgi:hypothetical protein
MCNHLKDPVCGESTIMQCDSSCERIGPTRCAVEDLQLPELLNRVHTQRVITEMLDSLTKETERIEEEAEEAVGISIIRFRVWPWQRLYAKLRRLVT